MNILLLEDDQLLNELITERLLEKYSVTSFFDGEAAMQSLCKQKFDLLLLDVDVPSLDGFSLLELLRNASVTTPAIFITAKTTSKDLRRGFDIGGNDYIKKPFDFEELEARIDNIRKTYQIEARIELGSNAFLENKTIIMGGKRANISSKEASILTFLVTHKRRFVSYDELTNSVWSLDEAPSQATIRTYIKNLRHILGANAIASERGVGWRYDGI